MIAFLRRTAGRSRPPWTALDSYLIVVNLVGGVWVAVLLLGESPHDLVGAEWKPFLIFAALLVFGELRPIKWLRLDNGGEVTMSWSFAFCLLLLGADSGATIAIAVASAIGDAVRRKPLKRLMFNASQLTLSLAVSGLIMRASGQLDVLADGRALGLQWFAALGGAAAAGFLVNGALTCVALALHEGTSIVAMLRRGLLPNLSTDGALLALAPCFLVIAERSFLLLPLILVTAGFVYRSSQAALVSEHAASHDSLTELLNRRAFDQSLDDWMSQTRATQHHGAVALIDLDGFKQINDNLGHHVGDLVLQEVGRRLTTLRRPGLISARLGGDEFAVLFTSVSSRLDAMKRAHEIHDLLCQEVTTPGFPVGVGGSVGITLIDSDQTDRESVMHQADVAMYTAKRNRSGVEIYGDGDSSHGGRYVGRLGLLNDLEHALKHHQLSLHYQPQFDVSDRSIVGIEALLRWTHPVLGMVPPSEFMPLAEQTELMGPLTEFVLDEALRVCASWWKNGSTARVAVNASAQNLQDLKFPTVVARALQRWAVPGRALEIELTENTVMTNPERSGLVLAQLRDLGVRLALDDFGTGYSSLTNLRDLPIQTIKIDRSFVRSLASDGDDQQIVRMSIELAHALRLDVVAEGVEDQPALDLLSAYGCDAAQGFLLGHPMPENDILALVVPPSCRPSLRLAS